jgi:mannose-6-phosphate isomerase-like protein (cupin superfamily)
MPTESSAAATRDRRYLIADFNTMAPVDCPCGSTRRAFVGPGNAIASIHYVDISADAKTHYHKKLTEIYLIPEVEDEGAAFMELDGERIPVRPLTTILIQPGCRHRAVGRMKIVNIPVPAFDPDDEWFD